MTSPKPTRYNATPISVASKNAQRAGELAVAAGQVIARRMSLGAAAMADPLNADHAEFARMVPEKVSAFAEAGNNWLCGWGLFAEQMARYAAHEITVATEAVMSLAVSTPNGAMAGMNSHGAAWFARAMEECNVLGVMAMRSQGAALAPLHRAATANHRRLGAA